MKKRTITATILLLGLLIASPAWATTLNWTDNSNIEDGFAIEQNGPGGWVEIARVGPDITTYVDAASLEGLYRVKAFITVDGEDIFSADSNKGAFILGPTSVTASQ